MESENESEEGGATGSETGRRRTTAWEECINVKSLNSQAQHSVEEITGMFKRDRLGNVLIAPRSIATQYYPCSSQAILLS
jgi:hypothetical protein